MDALVGQLTGASLDEEAEEPPVVILQRNFSRRLNALHSQGLDFHFPHRTMMT